MLTSAVCLAFLYCDQPSLAVQTTETAPKTSAAQPVTPPATISPKQQGDPVVLSDTRGVDFKPYTTQMEHLVRGEWLKFIPQEARPPSFRTGATAIRFTINQDGKLAAMHLEENTHWEAFNRSAWGAITSVGQFPPLPKAFTGPDMEFRLRFTVNLPGPNDDAARSSKNKKN